MIITKFLDKIVGDGALSLWIKIGDRNKFM